MPWRHCIFTDTGVVYPANWDMNALQGRGIPASMGPTELTDAASLTATLPQGPSGCIATQDLFSRKDAASPESPKHGPLERSATQDGAG
jgi:hypothetical protein